MSNSQLMTKDEQIFYLVNVLKSISTEHVPWTGEDAIDMRDEAIEALAVWRKSSTELWK